MKAESILDAKASLGEGAIWDPREPILWWIDIEKHTLFRFDPDNGQNDAFNMGQRIGTVVPREKPGLAVALENGFHLFDPATRTLTPLADPEAEKPENRFNDGKCDPAGRFWAGTMSLTGKKEVGALYCLNPDGTVHRRVTGVTTSNGICWSLDAATMYYIDTPTRRVDAFDYDLATGEISNRRPAIRIPDDSGAPDGMTMDENGNLWIAHWGGFRVTCYDPRTAELLETIEVPVARVTSCAFGGNDLRTLYITCASVGMKEDEAAAQPHAGSLFACQPGVRGIPAPLFRG